MLWLTRMLEFQDNKPGHQLQKTVTAKEYGLALSYGLHKDHKPTGMMEIPMQISPKAIKFAKPTRLTIFPIMGDTSTTTMIKAVILVVVI